MKKQKKTKIYEFFGYPGAGKTTIQSYIKNKHQLVNGKRIACRSDFYDWLALNCTFIEKKMIWLIYPLSSIKLFLMLILSCKIKDIIKIDTSRRIISFIKEALLLKCYIKSNKEGVLILDQAIIQRLWIIWIDKSLPNRDHIKEIILLVQNIIGADFSYIFLDVNLNTSVNRINQRTHGNSRFDRIDNLNTLKISISNQVDMMELIMDVLKKSGNSLLVISTENQIEKSTNKIIDWMSSNE